MIEQFCTRFAAGGQVLFRRNIPLILGEQLRRLGVSVDEHLKLPEVIVSRAERDWLILMEAGPIDEDRRDELLSVLNDVRAELVFVSCFAARAELRECPVDFAWGSSVWCADEPDHLIHFDGGLLLGSREVSPAA